MKLLTIFTCVLMGVSTAHGDSYSYPLDKRPSISMQDACGIGVKLLTALGLEKDFFLTGMSLWGDGTSSGGGAWRLECRNTEGDALSMSIHIDDDYCFVVPFPKTEKSKLSGYKEKGYTRDGQVSEKWLERERNRPAPRPRVTPPSQESKVEHISEEAEQAVAPNRSLPPSQKSTSPIRGPED